MATTVTVSSNYVGKVAGGIIGKSFKEADTIAKGLVTVMPDIDFQVSLRKIQYANGRVDYACGFTPTGSLTLSEKLLTPKKIKNEQEICKEDLRQIWSSATMGFSAHNDGMPKDVNTALLNEILGDTAEATDMDIWQGDATTSGEFDGFLKAWAADGSIIKVGNGIASLGAATDKTNVVASLEKVAAAIPVSLRRKKDMVFGVSPDVALAYQQSLITPQISNGLGGAELALQYGSFKLEVINGLPDNTFTVFQKKNLYFGTGLMADHNAVRMIDNDDTDLSGNVRYKMVYTAGVQYINSEEIVWFVSTAA